MKKTIAIMLALMVLALGMNAVSESAPALVYVTLSNGALIEECAPVEVDDVDEDGALTVNDVLVCFHAQYYETGAEGGFATEEGSYGLFITKLWGIENGGSYGYYLNDVSCFSLTDAVEDGDRLYAFVYTDLVTWSDTYTWFDSYIVTADADADIELTLCMAGYDDNWAPVSAPVEGAVITINGEATAYVTDANGYVSIKMPAEGAIISAESDSITMVPPVCIALIAE